MFPSGNNVCADEILYSPSLRPSCMLRVLYYRIAPVWGKKKGTARLDTGILEVARVVVSVLTVLYIQPKLK